MSMFWAARAISAAGEAAAASSSAASAAGSAQRASSTVRNLEKDLDRLTMICEAMWNILKEKFDLDDEELMARVAELDLSDGLADGRKANDGPLKCPKCSRPNSRRHDFCIYCGQLIRTKPFD